MEASYSGLLFFSARTEGLLRIYCYVLFSSLSSLDVFAGVSEAVTATIKLFAAWQFVPAVDQQ